MIIVVQVFPLCKNNGRAKYVSSSKYSTVVCFNFKVLNINIVLQIECWQLCSVSHVFEYSSVLCLEC